ncbi:Cell wall alpha-1,3-glucan synthase ags1 [Lithohypha guttulata]|uniref:alpha-1,3-glucan synthase n=1 Tax=Lithohypha guttulata TaxID=1690604 RepID=A0AAN7Y7P5_9EURO|nr:Cell wall alpha-1,3-glucan synthase ags1 [Lithohypha guttulata]KAK5101152.1 Cell wall alpha-1,3-glucan synthase ags1 [Lithohypha guttulata]
MSSLLFTIVVAVLVCGTYGFNYDPAWTKYNLNTNQNAQHPLEYSGEWTGHEFTPSPKNWRFPFYTLFLDRFVNGDPANDNINGTLFEHDLTSNQMRNGGDLQGLIDSLDYLHGMGIKGIYIAGSPFLNQPWTYDSYSPLDLTILDWHFGDIAKWREAVNAIHDRGMYVVLDNTFATLGDLLGFEGYLNETAPFTLDEHKVEWKNARRYYDFEVKEEYNQSCEYPRFWLETGYPVGTDVTDQMKGCFAGEFDQYGDTEAFGVYPDWRRQLTKFASVQDRLREWHEPVRLKLENFYCMMIGQLDIDGYRYDKAMQATVDAMGHMNTAMRQCARKYGKDNFFLPGEITGGNVAGAIYIGRGRQPDMLPENLTLAASLTNTSDSKYFIQEAGIEGLDAGAFHYTTYRTMTRFLGMDGNLEAGYDSPKNWVDQWNNFIITNDMVNANTGQWDPRHMFGVTNQDVFRWGAIKMGVQRQLLGHFVTTMLLPGIPLLLWGEEQAFYVLDNTATNYIFGRQPMSSALAWMQHGCYSYADPSTQYYEMPVEAAAHGCEDEVQMHDHRDPTHPIRNILRHMYHLRDNYPVLNDGMFLQQLSNQTSYETLPGSSGTPTEFGLWSVLRSQFPGVQDLSQEGGQGDLSIWLIYSNLNETTKFTFDCKNNDTEMNITALIAPFAGGTTVKNLFYPFDEVTLEDSARTLGINGSTSPNGCVASLDMPPYGFKAYVPAEYWVGLKPMMTKFSPGHDTRINSTVAFGGSEDVDVELQFSAEMDCDSVTNSITFNSTTESGRTPSIDTNSVECSTITANLNLTYVGYIPSMWSWKAKLTGVEHGVHALTVSSPAAASGGVGTNATDKLLFRIGQMNNPVIFPLHANYSNSLVTKNNGQLTVHHHAAGASLWRYSTNWGTTYSDWTPYRGGNTTIERQPWTGTKLQKWEGDHVRVEYYSPLVGQSDIVQQGSVDTKIKQRRFPHLFWNGPYNQYGYDAGLENKMVQTDDSTWEHHFMTEWLQKGVLAQINVWGINPDGKPDQSFVFGDIDQDSILDRLPPSSLSSVALNITQAPPRPNLGWKIILNDGMLKFRLIPSGSMWPQLALFILLWIMPIVFAGVAVWLYMQSFYGIKFNQIGIVEKSSIIPMAVKNMFGAGYKNLNDDTEAPQSPGSHNQNFLTAFRKRKSTFLQTTGNLVSTDKRRMVLIATMEYDIEDWGTKVKIGGLGVMAQLMGKNLAHQDLIWVVPCIGDIDYPVDTPADPMNVVIMGQIYEIKVQYHQLRNITYVLLDAPVFRQQTKAEPYPPRMDDLDSAIYYSAWNQCIAHAMNRFPIDLYHINDYHGSIAPLYLLPRTIPACLSLHNAEFQGLWPVRNKKELEEVCSVFNLPVPVTQRYVQFGEVFNLLHSGASILREQQDGFGAVGVSKKYGVRAWKRYPIFWGLKKVGQLPNPDPSDTGAWDKKLPKESDITVDSEFEASRGELRRQAQEWAGLEQNPNAELFVFVGRWSMQKGVDLIADVFPSVLEANPNVQLITIGPVIDLYGKFAAAKLDKMMKVYPGRVFSKPVFTALPSFIFSGAEFALIPSRDEPFGLVAVEFGRKGALGVGARVGGLGQMPGWWYTVESATTSHLTHQFRIAIQEALASKTDVRALMRARSAKQRFPVAQWVEDLEILQGTAIKIHDKVEAAHRHHSADGQFGLGLGLASKPASGAQTPSGALTPGMIRNKSAFSLHALNERLSMVKAKEDQNKIRKRSTGGGGSGLKRQVSLGSRRGPGHVQAGDQPKTVQATQVAPSLPPIIDTELEESRFQIGTAHSTPEDDDYLDYDENEPEDSASIFNDPGDLDRPLPGQVGTMPRQSPSMTPGLLRVPPGAQQDLISPRLPSLNAGLDTPDAGAITPPTPAWAADTNRHHSQAPSMLSVNSVVGDKKDYNLQKVDPFFTDSSGEFYREFEHRLEGLSGANSDKTCIEEFLVKSEKKWFSSFRDAKLGRLQYAHSSRSSFDVSTTGYMSEANQAAGMLSNNDGHVTDPNMANYDELKDEFLLGKDYTPPTGLLKFMQLRVMDWPVYSFFLAFGQIIAANSYQITLLTGEVGQPAAKLYVVASIYLVTSVVWWILFRTFQSRLSLSLPFLFYGMAFLFIAMAHFSPSVNGRGWIQNLGTAWYACASSSGSIFFGLNFGDEGGSQTKTWVVRACIIQGTQQIYVVVLWAWGSYLSKRNMQGLLASEPVSSSWKITAICLPIACMLWVCGGIIWYGLPSYYRQQPGNIPSFYTGITRRKIILWFFVTVVVQNFFLSAPYGRNWAFLFSSQAAPTWAIVVLVLVFFIGVWSGMLGVFMYLSKSHSWILPLFAIGLGAPRWAQIWWGTSNIGMWLPWAPGGTAMSSALLSRSLWLWLGTLDAIQGVGLGMILLVTLTRVHVAFTLVAAQVLGSIATMVSRASAPNRIGPGPISPDVSKGVGEIWQVWFWIGLVCNLGVCVGFFVFFRKEQLSKP